jgi:hypothetical protein
MKMVELLADERAETWGRPESTPTDHIFAGGILCEFFRPIKVESYSDAARECRKRFAGIYNDDSKQKNFRRSLTPELLGAASATEAIGLGFDVLIRPSGD